MGARRLLERELSTARISHRSILRGALELRGQLEVGHAIAIGAADVGIAMQHAAIAHGLDFIPLARERFDLVLDHEVCDDPRIARLLDTLCAGSFRRELEALGGYERARAEETSRRSARREAPRGLPK